MPNDIASNNRPVLAWLRLLRLPNVFTAIADVSMGFLVADGGGSRAVVWGVLVLTSAAIYLAGMVLNDVLDVEVDRKERPERPLPSGQIRLATAKMVGSGLLVLGLVLGWTLQFAWGSAAPRLFQPGWVVTGLVLCVLAYDAALKNTLLGPLAMGGCRLLNVLLGISVTQDPTLFLDASPLTIAGAIGLYVVGVTWFARHEAETSPRPVLFSGVLLMLLAVAIVTVLPFQDILPRQRVRFPNGWAWPFLVWLGTATVWRRAMIALYAPQPEAVQGTIKQALVTLIVLDAAIALLVAGPIYAVGLIALMIPTAVLSRWVYLT